MTIREKVQKELTRTLCTIDQYEKELERAGRSAERYARTISTDYESMAGLAKASLNVATLRAQISGLLERRSLLNLLLMEDDM